MEYFNLLLPQDKIVKAIPEVKWLRVSRSMGAECGNIKEYKKKFCKICLIRDEFLQGSENFLTEVKVPAKWMGAEYGNIKEY